ncbi:MAG: hypothetical protein WEB93_05345, partial [Sphingomonadales bacterium]
MTGILDHARRVVIKIGSALLVDQTSGQLHGDWLGTVIADVAALRAAGHDVILVSSGAVALGRGDLGLAKRNLKLEEK